MEYTPQVIEAIREYAAIGYSSYTIINKLQQRGLGLFGESRIREYMRGYRRSEIGETEVKNEQVPTVRDLIESFRSEHERLPDVPLHLGATRVADMGFDTPQEAVAVFSDYHYGGKVDPRVTGGIGGYNAEIARERLARWRNGVLRFTQMLQLAIQVPVLNMLALGDDMEGNGHMFPTQALQMEFSAYFQFMGFVEDVTEVLVSMLSRFEFINVFKVFGNHGRMAGKWKENYDPDNIELMAWQLIKEKCEHAAPGRFQFSISDSFWHVVRIQGYSFLIRHGDGLNPFSTYTGVTDTKLATNSILGEVVNYMVVAHHHTAYEREEEIEGSVIGNGCFVGPSLYALKGKRPRANRPSQEMFFVHPKYGITHKHRIHLATPAEVRGI